MKITAEMTAQEWVQEREMVAAHLAEWLERGPEMAKGAGAAAVARKPHPFPAVDQMTDRLSAAYRKTLASMNEAIVDFLNGQIGQEPY